MARQPTNSRELVTALIAGQQELGEDLFALLYDRLRIVAASMMQRERGNHTLQPTALVHEAWMNLIDQDLIGDMPVDEARCRFVGLAAHAMRRVLIDHARSGNRQKRGGGAVRVTLTPDMPLQEVDNATLLDLDVALQELAGRSERLARVAELRLFGGLSSSEIAPLLGVALTTVKDDWTMARAMLSRTLRGPG